jgi:uncharacterized membrane protein
MFKKDYTEFKEACKSGYFKLLLALILLVALGLVAGGLAGMIYTRYIDAFTAVFTIGVCLTGLLIFMSVFLCLGYCGI